MRIEVRKSGTGATLEARAVAKEVGRNLRAPHHTVSQAGLIGELALAACGVLLLDEADLFRGSSLLVLRNHLELMHPDARPVLFLTHSGDEVPDGLSAFLRELRASTGSG